MLTELPGSNLQQQRSTPGASAEAAVVQRKQQQHMLGGAGESKIPVFQRTLQERQRRLHQEDSSRYSVALLPPISPGRSLKVLHKKDANRGKAAGGGGGGPVKSKPIEFHVKSRNLIKITGRELARFPLAVFDVPGIQTLILSPEREACLNVRVTA